MEAVELTDWAASIIGPPDKSRPMDRPPPLNLFEANYPRATIGRLFYKPKSQIADWDSRY